MQPSLWTGRSGLCASLHLFHFVSTLVAGHPVPTRWCQGPTTGCSTTLVCTGCPGSSGREKGGRFVRQNNSRFDAVTYFIDLKLWQIWRCNKFDWFFWPTKIKVWRCECDAVHGGVHEERWGLPLPLCRHLPHQVYQSLLHMSALSLQRVRGQKIWDLRAEKLS